MLSIVGHDKTLRFLERTVREGRPAHGYLFTGAEGVGKLLVAKRFAAMVNCALLSEGSDCSCSSCRRIDAENHPDFLIERPERGMIRIERVRAIREFFRYAPVEARHRVCVVDDAHAMNRAAQNALLKTLEEPPEGGILILVSSKPSLLLPTVRSRCRKAPFGPIPSGNLADLLEARGITRERAEVLAAMSGGSVSRALEMDRSNFTALRDKMVQALGDPGGVGVTRTLLLSEEISKDKGTALWALEIASTWTRDLLLAVSGCDLSAAIHADSLDRIADTAQHFTSERLLAVYDELTRASELIDAPINVNRNLVTDVALLRVLKLISGAGASTSVDRS